MKNTQQAGQQAGIGIALALTTAICWGALPIAMKQVLTTMEPYTVVWYRFLMAGIGLLLLLAPHWLILLRGGGLG